MVSAITFVRVFGNEGFAGCVGRLARQFRLLLDQSAIVAVVHSGGRSVRILLLLVLLIGHRIFVSFTDAVLQRCFVDGLGGRRISGCSGRIAATPIWRQWKRMLVSYWRGSGW